MPPDVTAESYGYYPRLMVRLSTVSYLSPGQIPAAVAALGQKVVWGPAQLVDWLGVAYSCAYICQSLGTGETTVVIRGTNMMSWYSWESEDFEIGTTQPFNRLAPHAPASARISQGTYNGLNDLLKLTDPKTRQGIVAYLQSTKPSPLYVTGHSLGGTLTPPMFALLNDHLYGGGYGNSMAPWSFAGLTCGDAGFNDYFNGLFNPEFPWRLHNTLDIAPFCWWSLDNVANIYKPDDLGWGEPESGYITGLFAGGNGIDYGQPQGDQALPGQFSSDDLNPYFWVAQAMYQHHTSTYTALVDAAYPPPAELRRRLLS